MIGKINNTCTQDQHAYEIQSPVPRADGINEGCYAISGEWGKKNKTVGTAFPKRVAVTG
jgi:hypothetical protein